MIEVFKILRDFYNLDPDIFFSGDWRWYYEGHSFKLFKKRLYRLDVRKFKFASRVCEEIGTGCGMELSLQGL